MSYPTNSDITLKQNPNALSLNSITARGWLLSKNLVADDIVNNALMSTLTGAPRIGYPAEIENPNGNRVLNLGDLMTLGTTARLTQNLNKNEYQGNTTDYEIINLNTVNVTNAGASPTTYDKTPSGIYGDTPLTEDAITKRNIIMATNEYLDNTNEVIDMSSMSPATFNNQPDNYLDAYGNITTQLPNYPEASDVLSALMSAGVSLSNISQNSSFDFPSALANKSITGAGILNDTPLGINGAQQLAFAMMQNTQSAVNNPPTINTNIASLVGGGPLFLPSQNITVSPNPIIQVADILGILNGSSPQITDLPHGAFVYGGETSNFPDGTQITMPSMTDRNNILIKSTGEGQVQSLFYNLNASLHTPFGGYAPAYTDKRLTGGSGLAGQPEYYAPDLTDPASVSKQNSNFDSGYGTTATQSNAQIPGGDTTDIQSDNYVIWPDESITSPITNPFKNPRSLISKTFEMFNDGQNVNLITSNGVQIPNDEEIMSSVAINGNQMMSKGSAVVDANGNFCRTWSTVARYDKIADLQQNTGLWAGNKYIFRRNTTNSVLEDNGQVRVAPYVNDELVGNIKRFMFSIENLAWDDNYNNLPPQEQGPGDTLTGIKGRIVYFPPYGLNFTDNSVANWESTQFIGRPEPVYTYNNVERLGTLEFQLIIDHPSILNALRYTVDPNLIDSIMSGCQPIPDSILAKLTPTELAALDVTMNQPVQVKNSNTNINGTMSVYFPNDDSNVLDTFTYEINGYPAKSYPTDNGSTDPTITRNTTNFELNNDWNDFTASGFIAQLIVANPGMGFNINGWASAQGPEDNNQILSQNRATNVENYLIQTLSASGDKYANSRVGGAQGKGVLSNDLAANAAVDILKAKQARTVLITFVYIPALDPNNDRDIIDDASKANQATQSAALNSVGSRFMNEAEYFYKMSQENRMVYDDIRQKLRWFHPAFHSTTPEGLNSRLTFLLQCTRPGSTNPNTTVQNPDNLVFGRPPVCILRIGDFYHTKIIIDNINISYEPLVWDLNSTGVGVQPMIATVNMSFKFIGGSSLAGPISRLQNALSYNLFANTEIYSNLPDTIENGTLKTGWRPGTVQGVGNTQMTNSNTLNATAQAAAADSTLQNSIDQVATAGQASDLVNSTADDLT